MTEPIYCEACGMVHDRATHFIEELQATITQLGIEVARKQSRIAALRKEQSAERPPEYSEAMEVAEYWRERVAPRAKELNGARVQHTIARLQHGYVKEDLIKAVEGYAIRPNVLEGRRVRSREGGRRFADLELICRDAKHVDQGIEIYEAEMAHDQGLLDGGASRHVAELCDCGHARPSHGLFRLHGNEACYESGCVCDRFDSIHTQAEQWLTQRGAYDSKKRKPRVAAEGQESLL